MRYIIKKQYDVVIGTKTPIEYAFQICNFLTMLHNNIKRESQTMTNKVVINCLLYYIKALHSFEKQTDLDNSRFDFFYGQIENNLNFVDKFIKHSKSLNNNINKLKNTEKKFVKQLIESNKKTCYYYMNDCWKIIKTCMFNVDYFA